MTPSGHFIRYTCIVNPLTGHLIREIHHIHADMHMVGIQVLIVAPFGVYKLSALCTPFISGKRPPQGHYYSPGIILVTVHTQQRISD